VIANIIYSMLRLASFIVLLFFLSSCSEFKNLMGIKEFKQDIPGGEYLGTAKLVSLDGKEASDPVVKKIKINFIPKDPGITDGVGILTMDDESNRFFWRAEGNNIGVWSVLFSKDNNLYSNLKQIFNFDGILSQSETENKLEGRLSFDYDSKISQYFVTASQLFKPVLLAPKETITVKGGDSFEIRAEKLGEDQDKLELVLSRAATEKDPEYSKPLAIESIVKDKGNYILKLKTEKGLIKGSYSLRVIRDEDYKSNAISITVN
jgi:hypothetical protein